MYPEDGAVSPSGPADIYKDVFSLVAYELPLKGELCVLLVNNLIGYCINALPV